MSIPLSRRQFFQVNVISGALLLSHGIATAAKSNQTLTPLVKIHADNQITFYYPSPEMGQGTDTSLAMIFIDELGGDMNLVNVEPMEYSIRLNDKGEIEPVTVAQFSGGSTSISRNYPLLTTAGALTRERLLRAAANHWRQQVKTLHTENGFVLNEIGDTLSFGELVELAAQVKLPMDFAPTLKNKAERTWIGKDQPGKQVLEILTGKPLYGMDMRYPNAKVALVARSPWFDGEVKSVDDKAAKAIPGVHDIVILKRPDLDKFYTYLAAGVAVIADDFWTAKKARDALKIIWTKGPYPDESSSALAKQCDDLLNTKGQIVRNDGDLSAAIDSAARVISRTYQLPLVSHAQLEPQNCIAHVTNSGCTIIGPMQSPGGASRTAAEITGLERTAISLQYTRLGGGFGRRLSNDHVSEAVTISKQSGYPIKLIWTREDDLAHDFYRPMGHHQLTAGLDNQGNVVAWNHRLAGTSKHYRRNGKKPEEMFDADIYVDDFPAGLVSNLQLEYLPAKSRTPQGSWRAPAHTANAFVVQSFLDELAEEADIDPLQLRLNLLGEPRELPYEHHGGPVFDTGRMRNVLLAVADMASWGNKPMKNRGIGLAAHFTFGGYCAQIAEVELLDGENFKVHHVYAAIDVGTVINPEGVKAQVEGGINDGLSAALGQAVIIEGGNVTSLNFDTYSMARIRDSATKISVIIIEGHESPGGAGEMGIPPTAPAVANAIRNAGGKRFRKQPFARA